MGDTPLNWSDLALFLAVARGGGLAGGAAVSGISPPTLGRRMRALEQAMGQPLFERLPRSYVLTGEGERLRAEAEAVEERILHIERRRAGGWSDLPVRISAGTWTSRFLAQHMAELIADAPKIILMSSEARHDIARRETTIGLRNARPTEAGLAGRKVATIAFAAFATPGADPARWLCHTGATPSANWTKARHSAAIALEATHPRTVLDLATAGLGTAVLPCFVGDAEPGLRRTGPIIPELSHDQWLVVHDEERHRPSVRAIIERLSALIACHRPLFSGRSRHADRAAAGPSRESAGDM